MIEFRVWAESSDLFRVAKDVAKKLSKVESSMRGERQGSEAMAGDLKSKLDSAIVAWDKDAAMDVLKAFKNQAEGQDIDGETQKLVDKIGGLLQ